MTRLFSFGCSHTYGQHLSGAGRDNKSPSPLAWPSIFSQKLDNIDEFYNYAVPGVSNKFIWFNALHRAQYLPTDIVVIMWTYEHRTCILGNENPNHTEYLVTNLGTGVETKQSKSYYKNIYNEIDQGWDFWLRMDHVSKTLPCKVIHTTCHGSPPGISQPFWVENNLHCENLFFEMDQKYPKADDNEHAGEQAHYWFADQFADYCKRNVF